MRISCLTVALLCVSKLCREINTLRESALESAEAIHVEKGAKKILGAAWKFATSKIVAIVLSCLALVAASLEVVEDLSPGGHHGAVLLALNELMELLASSHIASGFVLSVLESKLLKVLLAGGASFFALIEIFSSGQIHWRGHHGVAVLALLKFVRCFSLAMVAWTTKGKSE